MKAPHDDKLQQPGHWPLKGKFIVKLLGVQEHQPSMEHVKERTFDIQDTHDGNISHNGMVRIGGVEQFVSHSEITSRTWHSDVYFKVQYDEDHISYRDIYTV